VCVLVALHSWSRQSVADHDVAHPVLNLKLHHCKLIHIMIMHYM